MFVLSSLGEWHPLALSTCGHGGHGRQSREDATGASLELEEETETWVTGGCQSGGRLHWEVTDWPTMGAATLMLPGCA